MYLSFNKDPFFQSLNKVQKKKSITMFLNLKMTSDIISVTKLN